MADSEGSEGEEELRYEIKYDGDEKTYTSLLRDGRATAKFGNGDTYVGDYKGGKRDGRGVYTFTSGAKYDGEYVAGKKHGRGTFIDPDKGTYTGEFQNDRRDGQGTYAYPNGHTYTGGWKNGAKHGKGTYSFGDTSSGGSSVTGVWSNGQCMHGTWTMHDGSRFIGKFASNAPTGEGLLVSATGNTQSGQYTAELRWLNEQWSRAAPTAQPPAPREPTPMTRAGRAVDKALIRIDQYDAIFELPKNKLNGVANFRGVQSTGVYGSAQPSLVGFKEAFDQLADQGFDKVTWINLRSEPIVYVNDNSYVPRDKRELVEPLPFQSFTAEQLSELDVRFYTKITTDVKAAGGLHHYYKPTPPPADQKTVEVGHELLTDEVKDPTEIRSLPAVFEYLKEENDVDHARIPIADDRAPSTGEFDALYNSIREVDNNIAVYFNCATGKGKTTTAMVIACLIRKSPEEEEEEEKLEKKEEEEEEEEEEDEEDGDGSGERKKREKKEKVQKEEHQDPDEFEPNYKAGQFAVIMKLVKAIENGVKVKADVDDAIDKCAALENIREAIIATKDLFDSEPNENRKGRWKRLGQHYLERYFFLIVFHSYLRELNAQQDKNVEPKSFTQWWEEKSALAAILGSRTDGALRDFSWT